MRTLLLRMFQAGITLLGAVLSTNWALLAAEAPAEGAKAAPASTPRINYNRDVRPILSHHCYACHGPDEGKRKAKLRLDNQESAHKKVIKPGHADQSPLVERIASSDPEQVMPPSNSKRRPLSNEEIEILRRWVDQGGRFDSHWAYIKPVRTVPPPAPNPAWVRNPIDAFIAAEHQARGFEPAPEADRITLIRRLSFDLIGLPPAPQEVDAFVKDADPKAYEKMVDRLLQSPHFGERMALGWLDEVRFADTCGYHSDNFRNLYLYRDYVIEAFNSNLPFDRFTIEQLGGDLLPHPTRDQRIASGYNRLLMTTEEGGAQAKEYLAKYAADRVRNVSSVWMAGTLGCAECHNHKFDPYTTRDFYSLAAFFADIREAPVGRQEESPLPTLEEEKRLSQIMKDLAAADADLNRSHPEWARAQAQWEEKMRQEIAAQQAAWKPVKPLAVQSQGKATLTIQNDLSVLASGENPAKDVYTVALPADSGVFTGVRLEALTHESLANHGLSRANGNFVLTGFEVHWKEKDTATPIVLRSAQADYEQSGYPVAHALDKNPNTGWAVDGHTKPANHEALFVFDKPLKGAPGARLGVTMKFESPFPQHSLGRFRLSLTNADKPTLANISLPPGVVASLSVEAARRSPEQKRVLETYFHQISSESAPLRDQKTRLENEKKEIEKTFPRTLVAMAGPARAMRILPRGNWLDDSGEIVNPGVPAFLLALPAKSKPATRLDLARWLVDRDNPLVARVFVNRLWKQLFGQGLARTLDDFGSQGIPPTHPELLDWLAVEFMESGWNVKHMIRLMTLSSAYRQSSRPARSLLEKDPTNQFLARQGRFRLDAELVRDNALSISGLLTNHIGGPSVKPYQPAGYWALLNFPVRDYVADKGADQYRRGLYTFWQRTFLHPSLLAFDAPTREECTVERPRSSTPLQALVLLNDPTFVEAARVFAEHTIRRGGSTFDERLAWAFQRAVSRMPRPEEIKLLQDLYLKQQKAYAGDDAAAQALVSTGDAPVPKDLNKAEWAAWTSVARTLLNMAETVTRY